MDQQSVDPPTEVRENVRSNRAKAESRPSDGLQPQFWLAYVANFALVAANSLMYRFAELVAYLGGTEQAAGAIVGTGFAAVLSCGSYLGQGIDRYGTRAAWVISTLLFIVGCGVISVLPRGFRAGLYVARTIYSIGMAGMFTCSVVHVQDLVPLHRRTEAIGILGTSGFLAMIAGANSGDGIFAIFPARDTRGSPPYSERRPGWESVTSPWLPVLTCAATCTSRRRTRRRRSNC